MPAPIYSIKMCYLYDTVYELNVRFVNSVDWMHLILSWNV